jgi:hypothetical protein
MVLLAQAGLTTLAVAGRGLNEGLGLTAVEVGAALGLWRGLANYCSLKPSFVHLS